MPTNKKTTRRPAAKAARPSVSRKTTKSNKKPVASRKPAVAAKKRSVRPKQAVHKRKLWLPLPGGRRLHLEFALKHSVKPVRRSKKAQRQPRLSRQAQAHLSISMVLIGVLCSVYFGSQVFASGPASVIRPAALVTPYNLEPKTTLSLPASPATRLRIADIAVDAEVISIGKQADGSLAVPSNGGQTGNYSFGPTPGEIGPAVIVGHVDTLSGPAVFWRLRELRAGQIITVDRKDGTTARFQVDSVSEYAQNAFPTEAVYGNIPHAGLRLITCSGDFSVLSQHYSNNLVVYASLVN